MNKLESLNEITQGLNEEKLSRFEKKYGNLVFSNFREILLKYNVVKPRLTYFKNRAIEFNLNYLLGFSEKKYEDFLDYYKSYITRIPNDMLVIGSVDGGDLLCMDNKSGEIYYWFHEANDWGLEGNKEYPTRVSSSLNSFLDSLIASELPTKEELERAQKEGKRVSISSIGLELLNKDRAKRGLPPLTMEEALNQ